MGVSDYRIEEVIRVYLRHLKLKTAEKRTPVTKENQDDKVEISESAMKKLIYERLEKKLAEMVNKHDTNS